MNTDIDTNVLRDNEVLPMIEVRNLKKDYTIFKRKHIFSKRTVEIVHAVKGLDFSISDGEKSG